MTRTPASAVLVLISVLAACSSPETEPMASDNLDAALAERLPPSDLDEGASGSDSSEEDTGPLARPVDTAEGETQALERSLCGQPPYTWLPTETMGELIAEEPKPLYSLPVELVTTLLADSDFIDILDLRYDVEVIALRHVSQDRGVSVETTALIGLPVAPEGESINASAVAFLAGTSGFSEACAGSLSEGNALAAVLYAAQGYVAVLPDYLGKAGFGGDDGLEHPYLVSEAAALATLDGLRAAKALLSARGEGLSHDGRVFLWGGSQGGHAVYATERYAPYYAPEFEVVGGIATVAPSDLVTQSERALITMGPASVGLLASCITLAEWYGMWGRVGEIVQNEAPLALASALREQMKTTCYPDLAELGITTTEEAFTPAFVAALREGTWQGFEDWRCLFEENSARHQSLSRLSTTPILSVLAADDELVDLAVEQASHAALCDQGYTIQTLVCDQASHTDGTSWSVREQFAWFKARMAGEVVESACMESALTCCGESPSEVCEPSP